jgi:outer membrane murein-binding lipoprotein Lpp
MENTVLLLAVVTTALLLAGCAESQTQNKDERQDATK